jgi:hypothetical protein
MSSSTPVTDEVDLSLFPLYQPESSVLYFYNDWLCPDSYVIDYISKLPWLKSYTVIPDRRYQSGTWYQIVVFNPHDAQEVMKTLTEKIKKWARNNHFDPNHACLTFLTNKLIFDTTTSSLQEMLEEPKIIHECFKNAIKDLQARSLLLTSDKAYHKCVYVLPGSERTHLIQLSCDTIHVTSYVGLLKKENNREPPTLLGYGRIDQDYSPRLIPCYSSPAYFTRLHSSKRKETKMYEQFRDMFDIMATQYREYRLLQTSSRVLSYAQQLLCQIIDEELTFKNTLQLRPNRSESLLDPGQIEEFLHKNPSSLKNHICMLRSLSVTPNGEERDQIYYFWLTTLPTPKITELSIEQMDILYEFLIETHTDVVLSLPLIKLLLDLSSNLKKLQDLIQSLPTYEHGRKHLLAAILRNNVKLLQKFGTEKFSHGFSTFPTREKTNYMLNHFSEKLKMPTGEPFITHMRLHTVLQEDFCTDYSRNNALFTDPTGHVFQGNGENLNLHEALIRASANYPLKVLYKLQLLTTQTAVASLLIHAVYPAQYYSEDVVMIYRKGSKTISLVQLTENTFTLHLQIICDIAERNKTVPEPVPVIDDVTCQPIIYGFFHAQTTAQFSIVNNDLVCTEEPKIGLRKIEE